MILTRRPLVRTLIAAGIAIGVSGAQPVHAQDPGRQSHWGVVTGFAPEWKVPDSFKVLFDAERIDVTGSDFRIGAAHGSDLGGDLEILYVQKTVQSGSIVDQTSASACAGTSCIGTTLFAGDVKLRGLEVDKFLSFVTIARRVQVGLTAGGGVASVKGQITRVVGTPLTDVNGKIVAVVTTPAETLDAKELFNGLGVLPLAHLEISVAGIVLPGLKVKAGGGFNFPGYSKFSLDVIYLVGAR